MVFFPPTTYALAIRQVSLSKIEGLGVSVDNLNYTYNATSNKILKVDDASNETASFKDVAGNDYDY